MRGAFKAHEYGDVILPFVVLRRLHLVLEPQKDAVIKQFDEFNEMLKRQWFDVLVSGMSDEGAVQGQ